LEECFQLNIGKSKTTSELFPKAWWHICFEGIIAWRTSCSRINYCDLILRGYKDLSKLGANKNVANGISYNLSCILTKQKKKKALQNDTRSNFFEMNTVLSHEEDKTDKFFKPE